MFDVSLQIAEHPGYLIAARPIGFVVHRHGHHRHQRLIRQFFPIVQEPAQRAGAQRQNHVVDLDSEPVLHA